MVVSVALRAIFGDMLSLNEFIVTSIMYKIPFFSNIYKVKNTPACQKMGELQCQNTVNSIKLTGQM